LYQCLWILKSTEHEQHRRILAAVDQDSEEAVTDALNRQILEMSTSLALAEEASERRRWLRYLVKSYGARNDSDAKGGQ